ncbi:11364_t:CDS:2, partial [Racocetra fulgida]
MIEGDEDSEDINNSNYDDFNDTDDYRGNIILQQRDHNSGYIEFYDASNNDSMFYGHSNFNDMDHIIPLQYDNSHVHVNAYENNDNKRHDSDIRALLNEFSDSNIEERKKTYYIDEKDKVFESIQAFDDSAIPEDRLSLISSSRFSESCSNIIEDDHTIQYCDSEVNSDKQTYFVHYGNADIYSTQIISEQGSTINNQEQIRDK